MTRIIEVEDNGTLTLPPEVLGQAKPHTRYIVEMHNESLILRPEHQADTTAQKPVEKQNLSLQKWQSEWKALSDELTAAWQSDQSVTEIISEMRR